jgi:ketosteroid isomerase-like protein
MTIADRYHDMIHQPYSEDQTAIRRRLDEIWSAAADRDFERLESFHEYGPKFTEFKDGRPRGDAATCAAGERMVFGTLVGPEVEMRDLVINVFGDVAVVTFNGHFTGTMHETLMTLEQQSTMVLINTGVEWRIVHEHMSPLAVAS